MKRLYIEKGLLLTDMEISYKGKSLILNRVLIDTGSASTIIAADQAATIGIFIDCNDPIYRISGVGGYEFVYSKNIDYIKIGEKVLDDIAIEVGALDFGFNLDGIIGLDVLQQMKLMINLDTLSLSQ